MTNESRAEGAWIFVSHSHRDLQKVRRVRDALEQRGHNPLLFFLRCLGDDSEIDGLVRREIEARTHFILCDSPNSRDSRWVQAETAIIKGRQDKECEVIDLDSPWEEQLRRIQRVARRATVSISYSPADSTVAEAIVTRLRQQDYAVFLDDLSLGAEGKWTQQRNQALKESLDRGWLFILLSPATVHSEQPVKKELLGALYMSKRDTNIIPVLARGREETLQELRSWRFPFGLAVDDLHLVDLTEGALDEHISLLIRALKTRSME